MKITSQQTILVTGGAGFIGSHLIEQLIDRYLVVCVDDFNDYYNPIWKQGNIKSFEDHSNFTLYKTDIRDLVGLKTIFENHGFSKIVHLAARAGVRPSIANPLLYEDVNVKGTLNLLKMAKQFRIPHFIFASSSSVYGNQKKMPFSETDPVNQPISPYAASKKSAEMFCYTYAYLYRVKMTCLRFFTVYGERGRPDMAPYLFTEALFKGKPISKFGTGKSERDYTYIGDIVNGIVKTLSHPFNFEIINLGNNKPVALTDFINTLEMATGRRANLINMPAQPGDVDFTYADTQKAKRLLKWQPKTTLKQGIAKFVKWYQHNRL